MKTFFIFGNLLSWGEIFRVKSCHATFLLYKSDGTGEKVKKIFHEAAGKTIAKEIEKVLNIPFQFVRNVSGSAKKT